MDLAYLLACSALMRVQTSSTDSKRVQSSPSLATPGDQRSMWNRCLHCRYCLVRVLVINRVVHIGGSFDFAVAELVVISGRKPCPKSFVTCKKSTTNRFSYHGATCAHSWNIKSCRDAD